MIRTIVTLIAILFFTINTHLLELMKLPLLYHHYCEHKSQDPSINFIYFIAIHYHSMHSEETSENHESLPYKSFKAGIPYSAAMLEERLALDHHSFLNKFIPVKTPYRPDIHKIHLSYNIWQPPRA